MPDPPGQAAAGSLARTTAGLPLHPGDPAAPAQTLAQTPAHTLAPPGPPTSSTPPAPIVPAADPALLQIMVRASETMAVDTPAAVAAEATAADADVDADLTLPGLTPARGSGLATARPAALPIPILDQGAAPQQLGERVAWMVGQGLQRAELQLDPPHLGRVEVSIVMRGEQMQLAFATDTGAGRDLLEAALPRLRDSLQDTGITLADVNVSTREREGARGTPAQAYRADEGAPPESEAAATLGAAATGVVTGTALLDLFV